MPAARKFLAVLAAVVGCAVMAGPARAATFTVNSTADQADLIPGDNACDSNQAPGEQCTLRAAVQETNALNDVAPSHTINVPAGTYTLTGGPLTVTWNLNLAGAGARSTFINQTTLDRVFSTTRTVNFSGIAVSGGTADSPEFYGGNIFNNGGTVTITDSKISGGHAGSGGGVGNQFGTMTIRSSTLAGNAADIGGGDGGAILNIGNADLSSRLTVENSTISGNSARLGGGIISYGNAGNAVTVKSSTIASNSSTLLPARGGGGGLLVGAGNATVENSIVALNSSASMGQENCSTDVGASITSLGFNLESGRDCRFTATGDRQNANPLLGPLQNAGGPTDTRPLLTGSPAIDAGNTATCPATDQRGIARPQGTACDIGAYELVVAQAPPDTVIVTAPPVITRDRTPTFTFSSNRSGTTFECSLDNGPFLPCTSPYSLPRLVAGTHTLEVRARDATGSVDPTPASFTFAIPAELSDLSAPVIGKSVNAEPVSGEVFVAVPQGSAAAATGAAHAAQKGLKFVPLLEAKQVPIGSFFDTSKGKVRLQSATLRKGKRQQGVFSGGLFQTLQSGKKSAKGVFELRLKGSSFSRCRSTGKKASISRRSRRTIRRVSGNAKGRFRTRGRYSAATVRGTVWTVSDRCDGTLTKVSRGRVAVRDFRRRRNVLVGRGKSYLARAPG